MRMLGAMGLVLAQLLGTGTLAHEGHAHTVMGTVSSRTDTQLFVKTKDGKDVSIALNDKTTVTRGPGAGTGKLTMKDVVVGQRVVVNVGEGKTPFVARDIKLGVAAPAPSSSRRKPQGTRPPS